MALHPHPSPRRYPLEPLAATAGLTVAEVLKRCGCAGGQWAKYKEEGISEKTADRYAVRLGLLPSDVWPSWYEDQAANLSKPCADEMCEEWFIPTPGQPRHRFCSKRCRKRTAERERQRRLLADETAAEVKRARQRRYHAETRSYANRRRNERYWADRERELERQRAYYRSKRRSSGGYKDESPTNNADKKKGNITHPQQEEDAVVMGSECVESPGRGTNDPQPSSRTMAA